MAGNLTHSASEYLAVRRGLVAWGSGQTKAKEEREQRAEIGAVHSVLKLPPSMASVEHGYLVHIEMLPPDAEGAK